MNKEEKKYNADENLPEDENNHNEEDKEVTEEINTRLKRNKDMSEALKKVLKELGKDNKDLTQ